jgi:uncharacterized protein YggE
METKPDTIRVSALKREEISATHADLHVTVRGSSVFSGNEAMKKAREVSELVEDLKKAGIDADSIHLQGVHVETSSSTLHKSSSAIYRLRIRCWKLEQVPALIDIIAARKNAVLDQLVWRYPEEEARARLLESAIAAAKSKAAGIAAALGVKLLGVYAFNENNQDEETPFPRYPQAMMMKAARAAEPEPSLDMEIQHSKFVQVNVDIEYRVSGF